MKRLVLLLCILFLISGPSASAQENQTQTAIDALQTAKDILIEMNNSELRSQRLSDLFDGAQQLFAAQNALEREGGNADYSIVLEKVNELSNLYPLQVEMHDELSVLERKLTEGDNITAHPAFLEAKREFQDGRYEKVPLLIEKAYDAISEEQAMKTKARSFYRASTKSVFDFFTRNWKWLLIGTGAGIIVYLFLHKPIKILILDKKMNDLKFEREVLKRLTKKSQNEYFQLFKIPEELYYIRIGKFGELIRDIDRQILLLAEEKQRLKGTSNTAQPTLKSKVKAASDFLSGVFKRGSEEVKAGKIAVIPEEIAVRYGLNVRTIALLLKASTSPSRLSAIAGRIKAQRRKERRIRLTLQKKQKEEAAIVKEKRGLLREMMRMAKKHERMEKAEALYARFISRKESLYRTISSFLRTEPHLVASEQGRVLLKKSKQKRKAHRGKHAEREAYIQSLLQKRSVQVSEDKIQEEK